MPRKLGILAGGGRLPKLLIEACRSEDRPFTVIGFEGHADPDLDDVATVTWLRLGAGAAILRCLGENKINDIVLAGSIRRPTLRQLRPDLWGIGFLLRSGALSKGDDGLLRALIAVFEERGFRIVGADSILPALVTPLDCPTDRSPDEAERTDIGLGIDAARSLGKADKGQGVVISNGHVIAREAADGTDAMLSRLDERARGGVLVKCAKPMQDLRVDLPAAGLNTVLNAHAAGLSGIALEAGRSLLIDRDEMIAAANERGLFITGVTVTGNSDD